MGGGGGGGAPPVYPVGAPPVPVNPFGNLNNMIPNTSGQGGSMKDWSGIMGAPQSGTPFFGASQAFPRAPFLTNMEDIYKPPALPTPVAAANPAPTAPQREPVETLSKKDLK